MPVQACTSEGQPGWQWGAEGHCYVYAEGDEAASNAAKKEAFVQGLAIGEAERSLEERAVSLTVTREIADAARKGLDLYEAGRGGDGLVAETIRDARVMARKGELSEEKVRKMPAWFARHATDKRPGWDAPGDETPGYVAFLLWGGESAADWAQTRVDQMDAERDLDPEDVDAPPTGKTRIVVSDIDDTLLRNGSDPIDKTIVFLNELDLPVFLVTGRTEDERDQTAEQLERAGVEYAILLTNNTDQDTIAYKQATMRSLAEQYDVVLAIENDRDARAAYEDLGVEAIDPTELPSVVAADAGSFRPDPPGIEQKALPMDADAAAEALMEASEAPESLCDLLAEQLADVVAFKMIAHGYHWNVKGPAFAEYHALFSAIYEDADASIDPLAENILKLGYDAPFRLSDFQELRELAEPAITPDTPAAMAQSLLDLNEDVLDGWNEAYAASQAENQQGIANFIAERIDAHQKWAWQLRASVNVQPQEMMTSAAEEAPAEEASMGVDPTGKSVPDKKIRIAPPVEYQQRALTDDKGVEHRVADLAQFELREMTDAADAGGLSFSGYAAVFDSESQPLPFTETIKRGAFANTLRSRNEVKMFLNHDSGRVLASRRAGTLRLMEDATGLRVEADLPDTTEGRDLAYLIKRGDVSTMSFGFTVPPGGDYWSDENNRELRDVRLHEVSVVTGFPAYEATMAGVRSLDALADRTGLDADALSDAMGALERGDTLTAAQADLLAEGVVKLREAQAAPPPPAGPSVAELQALLEQKKIAA